MFIFGTIVAMFSGIYNRDNEFNMQSNQLIYIQKSLYLCTQVLTNPFLTVCLNLKSYLSNYIPLMDEEQKQISS